MHHKRKRPKSRRAGCLRCKSFRHGAVWFLSSIATAFIVWTHAIHAEEAARGTDLPSEVRKTLDVALEREARAKKIGTVPISRFPLPVCSAGKCGAVNRDGTLAIPFAYNRVASFSEGIAVVEAVEVPERFTYVYGYVTDTGRTISKPQFGMAGAFFRGFGQVDVEGQSGLIDREGRVALWPKFGFVVPFTNDLFWATEERKIISGVGMPIFLFDTALTFVNGVTRTSVLPSGKWGLVDRAAAWVRSPEFLAIRVFDTESQFMWAKTEEGWGLIRPDLSWQIAPTYENVGHLYEGLAMVELNKRWGFVDARGQVVIEPAFERVGYFTGPYAPARLNNLYGLIDRSGGWVLSPRYEMIYADGILMPKSWWTVKNEGKTGLLDDRLREVIPPQFSQSFAMCDDGRIGSRVDKQWAMFDRDGTPLESNQDGCDSMTTTRRR